MKKPIISIIVGVMALSSLAFAGDHREYRDRDGDQCYDSRRDYDRDYRHHNKRRNDDRYNRDYNQNRDRDYRDRDSRNRNKRNRSYGGYQNHQPR